MQNYHTTYLFRYVEGNECCILKKFREKSKKSCVNIVAAKEKKKKKKQLFWEISLHQEVIQRGTVYFRRFIRAFQSLKDSFF